MNWLKKIALKIAAKKAAKALDLTEGSPMDNKKPWYKSKTVLTGVVTVLVGTYESIAVSVAPDMGWNLPAIPPMVFTILGAIGIYTRTIAKTTLTK